MSEELIVLYMIDNLRPGGAQKVLLSLVKGLDRSTMQPVVWCLGGTSHIERLFREAGVEVIRFHPLWMYTGIACLRMLLFMLWRRVAIIHTFLFHADNLGRLLGRVAGTPVIISSVRATNVRKRAWQLRLDRLTARWAHAVTAVSRKTLDFAVAHEGVSRERAVFIPNGIDLAQYASLPPTRQARVEIGFPADAFVVGSVGRLHEQKGYRYLLEAAAILCKEDKEIYFFIAGYGPERSSLEAKIREERLEDRVKLLGYRTDVSRLLAAMDIFVLPSLWEGMPNALLEAMAAGRAVVATRVDGNVDLVLDGETGILVPPADPIALAAAIRELRLHPERAREMGLCGRERAEREFSIERMVESYRNLYNQLWARRRRALSRRACTF